MFDSLRASDGSAAGIKTQIWSTNILLQSRLLPVFDLKGWFWLAAVAAPLQQSDSAGFHILHPGGMLSACYISQWAARDGTPPSFCTACCGSMSVIKDCWERLRTGMFIISGIFKWDDCHFILLLLCETSDPLRPLKHIMNKRFSLMQLTHKNDVFTSDAVQKLC